MGTKIESTSFGRRVISYFDDSGRLTHRCTDITPPSYVAKIASREAGDREASECSDIGVAVVVVTTSLDVTDPIQANPGSDHALQHGCACDVVANDFGRLRSPLGWWLSAGCPLHGRPWRRAT